MIGAAIGKPIGGIVNLAALSLGATSGSYALTGPAAALTPSLAAMVGAYAVNGQVGAFTPRLAGAAGGYAIAGQGAAFIARESWTSGAYVLNGQGAPFAGTLPIASGVYAFGGNAAFLRNAAAAASGAYAFAGSAILLRVAVPAAPGFYTLVRSAAALTQGINGAGGTQRKRRGAIRLAERTISVTRDGITRRVGYVQRFRAPPALEQVPEWVLPQQRLAAPAPDMLPLRFPIMVPPPSLPEMPDDLAALRDESDLLDALARLPDPLQEGVAVVLAAVL